MNIADTRLTTFAEPRGHHSRNMQENHHSSAIQTKFVAFRPLGGKRHMVPRCAAHSSGVISCLQNTAAPLLM